jgi:hypothetical protein
MAIITAPALRIASIAWRFDRPAQVNRSAYTGRRKVMANPWHARWSAELELAPIVGEANILAFRAFLAQLKGQVNSFRLKATEGAQLTGAGGVGATTGAAVGATSLAVAGFPTGKNLLAGQMMTVNDQLLLLTQDGTVTGTNDRTFTFESPLRAAVAGSALVEVMNPTALVCLTSSVSGWDVSAGTVYGAKLSVEEVF